MEKKDKFTIEPSEVQTLMSTSGASDATDLLRSLVPAAQLLARPPISNFSVGVAALGASGRIYLGCNLEFPGLPLHHSVHAEQFLITNASIHGETQIISLAVSAAPCGHCRQFLQELRNAQQIRILVTSDPDPEFRPLIEFLPRPFGPVDLLHSDLPLLLEKRNNDVIEFESSCVAANGHSGKDESLVDAAVEAARGAHAPYSGCPSGFAMADKEGRVYKGSYMESAAYNPSLGPVQAAVVGYLVGGGAGGGGNGLEAITEGVLVEGEGAKVSHEGTARVFFDKVAPEAKVWVRRFRIGV